MTDTRPLLLLDVDGTVSAEGMKHPERWGYNVRSTPNRDVTISHSINQELIQLQSLYDIVWCTGWGSKVRMLEPLLGFSSLPICDVSSALTAANAQLRDPSINSPSFPEWTWKLAPVEEFVKDRAVAWVDDRVGKDAEQWALQRQAPTLLAHVYGSRGIQPETIQYLRQWAQHPTQTWAMHWPPQLVGA